MQRIELRELNTLDEMLHMHHLIIMSHPDIGPEDIEPMLTTMVDQGYKAIGLYDGTRMVGVCGYWVQCFFYTHGNKLQMDNMVIHPDYRDQGLGSRIIEWMENKAKELGCKAVVLETYVDNPRSHKLYFKHDMHILGFHFTKFLKDQTG